MIRSRRRINPKQNNHYQAHAARFSSIKKALTFAVLASTLLSLPALAQPANDYPGDCSNNSAKHMHNAHSNSKNNKYKDNKN